MTCREGKTMLSGSCSGFHLLPEDFIANALSLTSPKDACRLSLVASTFRSAADSDVVWERFLPPDYADIISRSSVDGSNPLLTKFRSKKELYFYLCDNPIIIDGGTKSFALEKGTGKKCFMLAARDLFIMWGDTPQYWSRISLPKSRFPEVAEVLEVTRFEVRGKINVSILSSGTKYSAYLVFTTKSRFHGFDYQPAKASVGISGHDGQKQIVCLDPNIARRLSYEYSFVNHRMPPSFNILWHGNVPVDHSANYARLRADGWMEVELGEFLVEGNQDWDVEISLVEVKGGYQKWGLIIQGIEIRPKGG